MTDRPASQDAAHMARALELASLGLYTTDPNPRVGCVLANGATVIAEGWHRRAGEPHAEALALRAAGANARGATAYVTLEPCSHVGRTAPCADALIGAGIARVVAACADPNPKVSGAGFARLRAAGIEVAAGIAESGTRALNAGFFSRFERGRPFVRLKTAMSLDGRTALRDGSSRWITGPEARADVQEFRARSSAICTGAGTVRADDPRLDVRLAYGPWVRQPLRVILDPMRTCARAARVFRDSNFLLFAARDGAAPDSSEEGVIRVACSGRALDLAQVMSRLAEREVNELLVECGPRLAAALLGGRWVDELIVYMAPLLLGADAAPFADLRAIASIAGAPRFEILELRRFAADLRLTLKPGTS